MFKRRFSPLGQEKNTVHMRLEIRLGKKEMAHKFLPPPGLGHVFQLASGKFERQLPGANVSVCVRLLARLLISF